MTELHSNNAPRDVTVRRRKLLALPRLRRWTIYLVAAGTWATGGIWLIYHYFVTAVDEFGFEGPDPWEKWWIIIHAGFGVWALWLFGSLWYNHIKVGWRLKKSRWSGGILFGMISWMAISGYLLYYLVDAEIRELFSLTHWILGLAGLAVFLIHIFVISFRKRRP